MRWPVMMDVESPLHSRDWLQRRAQPKVFERRLFRRAPLARSSCPGGQRSPAPYRLRSRMLFQRVQASVRALLLGSLASGASPARMNP